MTRLEDRVVPSGVAPDRDVPGLNTMPASYSYSQPSGFLTGPQAGDRDSVARSTLANFATGLTPADIASAAISDSYTSLGTSHVYFRQQVNGLPVINSSAGVSLMPDGRAIMVNVAFVPNAAAVAPPVAANGMSATDAVEWAAFHLGYTLQTAPTVLSRPGGVRQTTVVSEPEFSDQDIKVQRGYVNTPRGLRDVWELVARTPDGQHWYDATVDAQDGKVEFRSDWVDHFDTYHVVPAPNESPQDGGLAVLVNPADPVASPYGWHDTNGVAGAEFNDTRGNNVSAQEDLDANDTGGQRPDGGPNRVFDFPFLPTQDPSTYLNLLTTNLFYANNVMHDVSYKYGFDEASGNFQTKNYTGQGFGDDAVQADSEDGSGTDNANFATPPDGMPGRMQMYRFDLTTPNRDSDLDNDVMFHEYTHGISNRLTGGPADANALDNLQSGGMGEGWSDFMSLMLTQRPSDQANDKFGVGTYVLGQPQTGDGVRQHPYSFDKTIDPMTFSDYGTGSNQDTEAHWTGALWCSALWDMNWLLINKYGYDQDLSTGYAPGGGPASAGNKLAIKLVLDGMKLQAANPTFMQARDAILAADVALTGGVNQREIWTAFARRGLGAGASTTDSDSDTIATSFSMPSSPGTTDPAVIAQSPAGTTGTTPASLTLTFSETMNPSSFSVAADVASFTGPGGTNLLPAITGFAWTSGTTLRIDFTAQTAQGLYTMVVGPNILAADNGAPMNQDFDATSGEPIQDRYTANFRYDATPLTVTAITPATGGIAALTTSAVDVTFSEPVLASSLTAGDLNLSLGTVTGVTMLSPTQARFAVSGFTGVGEATVYISLKYGAATDPFGFPSQAFNSSFGLDLDTIAFPTPLTAAGPLGSLAYSGLFPLPTNVASTTDTDDFTINLDANQRLSAIVIPATGTTLVPTVSIFNGSASSVTSGLTPGQAVTATLAATTAGTYTIRVSGNGSSTGSYSLQLLLNASGEAEQYSGVSNDTSATAQSLDTLLSAPAAGVGVTTVVGTAGVVPTESEPNGTTGSANNLVNSFAPVPGSSVYQMGWTGNITAGDFDFTKLGNFQPGDVLTIAMSGAATGGGTLDDTYLELFDSSGNLVAFNDDQDFAAGLYESLIYRFTVTTADTYYLSAHGYSSSNVGTYRVGVRLENAAAPPLTGGNFTTETENNDTIGTANDGSTSWRQVQTQSIVTGTVSSPSDTDVYSYTLTAGDRVTIHALSPDGAFVPAIELDDSSGTMIASEFDAAAPEAGVYGYIIPTTGTYYVQVTSSGTATGAYRLETFQSGTTPPTPTKVPDFFSVTVGAGQVLSAGLAGSSSTSLQIIGTDGTTVLATGTAAGNYTTAASITAASAGVYFVRVADTYPTAYSLTVAAGATLDREPNSTSATAIPLGSGGPVLGGLTSGDSDWYSVIVGTDGMRLRAITTTPGDGPGEFVNTLDPIVEIYDPSGTLIVSDDNSAGDGRNARAATGPLPAGTYRVRVRAAGTTTGEYTLETDAFANNPPTSATAGGPYAISEGNSLVLSASGTDPDGDPLTYTWDVNGDGVYTDATGQNPTLTWAQLVALGINDGPYAGTVRVRVTDTFSTPITSSPVALTVANAAPTATIVNSGPVPEGTTTPVTVNVTNAVDPSVKDTAAGIHFAFDLNNDGSFEIGNGTYAGSGTTTSMTIPAALLADGGSSIVVRVRVMDDDGAFNDYLTTVVVTNTNPTAGLTNGGPVDEGSSAFVTATGTDVPADQPTLRYAFDFGNDGTYEIGGATYAQAVTTKTATVPTTDSGPLQVRVRVFDKDGGFTDAVTTITVNNIAPTATLSNGGSVVEGSTGAVSFTNLFDPSSADTAAGFTYDFDFDNNGTFDLIGATSPNAVVPAKYLPDGPATVTVRARVSDKDGGSSEYTTTITVTNAPPTATLSNGGAVPESMPGSVTFSNQFDPSPIDLASLHYAYDFNNDGTFDVGGDTYAASVTSASVAVPTSFLADGPSTQTIRARVYDHNGAFTEYTTTLTVTNANPTGTLTTDGPVPLGTPTVVRFTNVSDSAGDLAAGLTYQYTFTVNGQVTTLTSPNPQVDYTFPEPGTYFVLARVSDHNGGFSAYTTTAVVTNVPPTAVLAGSSTPEGGSASVTFTTATHPSATVMAAGIRFSYDFNNDGTFDLGDGTYAGSVLTPTASLPASLLLDSGTRTVRARAIEVSGTYTDVFATVTITPAPPTGTLTAPASARAGQPIPVTFSNIKDPSPADQAAGFTYSFDLDGDGVFETKVTTPTVSITLPGVGVRTIVGRVTDQDGAFTDLTTTITIVPPPRDRVYAVGADAGGLPKAKLFLNNAAVLDVTAFDASFTGGVRVATGDVNGDGVADLIVGTGPGIATKVRVLSGKDGSELFSVAPFEAAFTGGVYVAAGDLDGDGKDEVVVTPDEGGGPRVVIFRGGTFTRMADFFGIDDTDFRGGARVAVGDMNGDAKADLLVAAGFGGGPRVTAYDGSSVGTGGPLVTLFNLFVFEQSLRNGVFVSAGDLDGDGTADLVVGGGPGGGPRVLGLSGADLTHGNLSNPKTLANFLAGDVDDRGGVRVAAKNLDSDGLADLVVGDGAGSGGRVKTYLGATLASGSTDPDLTLDATPGFTGGVFVG